MRRHLVLATLVAALACSRPAAPAPHRISITCRPATWVELWLNDGMPIRLWVESRVLYLEAGTRIRAEGPCRVEMSEGAEITVVSEALR